MNKRKPFMLGAMYWLNPNYGVREIEEDMRRIRDNNFNIIRSFIWWEKVEPRKGVWDFRQHDILLEAADKFGIKVMETFGLYLPLWLLKELLEKGIDDRDKRYPCFDRPEVSVPMENFVSRTVERYKDAPALAIWNLWNEPNQAPCTCPSTLKRFAEWLKAKYPDIEALREAWLGECQVFTTACPESLEELSPEWLADAFEFGSRGRVTPVQYDFYEFNTENLDRNMRWLRDTVRSIDPVHETHANPDHPTFNGMECGLNEWKLGKTLDSISVSLHPTHYFFFREKEPKDFAPLYLHCIDSARSWAQGRDAWVGEFQAGTTYYHQFKFTPSPEDITHTLYHSLGRGLRGVLFWEWQSWRSSMMEVGEFSLRRVHDGGPTERSEAAKLFGADIRANAEILAQAEPVKPEVAILASVNTRNLTLLQHQSKPHVTEGDDHNRACYGCYKALNHAHIAVNYITECQIEEGVLNQYKVLYLPHVMVMSKAVADKIREFTANGGAVWADGRCAYLDEHVFLRRMIPGHGLDEMFGCQEADFIAARDTEFRLGALRGYMFRQYLAPTTGDVLAEENGKALIVRNKFGKGETLLAGSYITLGLQRLGSDEATMNAIAEFAFRHGVKPVLNVAPSAEIECSVMYGPHADVFILGNRTQTTVTARVELENTYVSFAQNGVRRNGGTVLEQPLAPEETVMVIGYKK